MGRVAHPVGSPARSTAHMGVHTLASRLVVYVSGFVASLLVAHALGPTGNGHYSVAMTVGTIAALVGSLGFEQAQARAWSSGSVTGRALYGTAIRVSATTGLAGAGLMLTLWAFDEHGAFQGVGLLALVIAAGVVPFRVLLALLRGLLIVQGGVERSNVALAAGDVARTVVIGTLALTGGLSVETVLAAFWLTVLLPLLAHAVALGRPLPPSPGFVGRQLRAGVVLSPYFVFLFLNLRLDVLLLAKLSDARAVGVYAVAVVFAELLWLVTDAIATAARERQWGPTEEDALHATAASARMSLLVGLLLLPILSLLAPAAIHLFFGSPFADATQVLWALLPAAVAMAWWRALSGGLVRFGRPMQVNGVAFAALATNVVLNLWLIPWKGIEGAAMASLTSYTLGALLAVGVLRGKGLRTRRLLPGRHDVVRLVALGRRPLQRVGGRHQRG
jgi:O-antigen/teichoic acid export membrane protein